MLSNLFGKKEDETADRLFIDKVYIISTAKIKACVQLAKDEPGILFIAWFSDTAKTYKNIFVNNGLPDARIIEARIMSKTNLQNCVPVFLEHYPLHSKEIELVENWAQKNMLVFSAMDEPLFKHFGSDKMIPLIKLFGMKESEAIEHSYVTQSIIKGQQKIADKVSAEQLAGSQAEWMEKNLGATNL